MKQKQQNNLVSTTTMNDTTKTTQTIVPIATTSTATASTVVSTVPGTTIGYHPTTSTPDNNNDSHDNDTEDRKQSNRTSTTINYNNPLTIDNPYLSVLSLIDITYPPLICSTCDRVATSDIENRYHHHITHYNNRRRRYPCLHAHCELSFNSRTALRYHLSRSHLVKQASLKHIRPEPPFMHYRLMPPLGSFTPTTTKPSALYHNSQCHQHHHSTTTITSIVPPEEQQQQQSQSQLQKKSSPPLSSSSSSSTTSSTNQSSLSFKIHTAKTFAASTLFPVPPSPPQAQQPSSLSLSSSSSSSSSSNNTSSTSTPTLTPTENNNNMPRLSPTSEALINSVYHPLHCPCCHEHFPRKTNVVKHVAEMHQDQEPYTCVYDNCTGRKCYATRDGLVYHTLRVHDSNNNNEMDIDENNNEWIKPSLPEKHQGEEQQQQQENGTLIEEGKEKQPVKTAKRKRSKNISKNRPDVRWAIHR